jgi:UTP--glucose-1-phosphate uridylyltransferase
VRQGEPLGLGHAVSICRKHIGDNPFVVLLGDDMIDERVLLLEAMIEQFDRLQTSVIALMEVDNPSLYGCARAEPAGENLVKVLDIVEKPAAADAPSNLAVMGRYVFTPDIFDALAQVQPGVGGEIQLTDAIGVLLDREPVYGVVFSEGRYDIGRKFDLLRANIELGLERDDLRGPLEQLMVDLVHKRGLT